MNLETLRYLGEKVDKARQLAAGEADRDIHQTPCRHTSQTGQAAETTDASSWRLAA